MSYPSTAKILVRGLTALSPEAARAAEDSKRESVATTVWLVSLASAALALLINSSEALVFASATSVRFLVALLALSVVFGIGHRLTHFLYAKHEANARLAFLGYLFGYESSVPFPVKRESDWSDDMVVSSLKDDFDIDYGFLLERQVPSETIRSIYDGVYETWARADAEHTAEVVDRIGQYMGLDSNEARRRFGLPASPGDQPSSEVSVRTPQVALLNASTALLFLSGGSLAVAALLVAGAFIW